MNKTETIRIILADAQPVFREGIKSILAGEKNRYIIQEAGNTKELVSALKLFTPDILILDYNPVYFDYGQLSIVLSVVPRCKVIIISSQKKKRHILKTLELNVYSYLTKESKSSDIQNAISTVIHGEKFFSTFIVDVLLAERKSIPKPVIPASTEVPGEIGLTSREIEIIRSIATGQVNKEIASALNLSPHTIHTHRRNIMKKLNLHSAVELYGFAVQKGILKSE